MACEDRQLTEAQRQAGYEQQRTGVPRAVRPFTGRPTLENLIDYINRELQPAVKQTRDAVNDVYLPVVDNAPSANPLAFYFSTETGAADPTAGRVRLNAATQNTASIIRISEDNARLQDVLPWLEVMAGGVTAPLGVVTLYDAVNPSRFLRFDLETMTDQGDYWDLGVTIVESSHPNPFVDGGAVTLSYIPGVADNEGTGAVVPPGSIEPIATDTFLGNISGSTAAPSAVPLANVDSTSIVYDATSHTFQSAAKTGDVTAAQNSNAFAFRSFSALSVLARAANSSGVPTELAAAANDRLLARTSDALSFTQLTNGMVPTNTIGLDKLANIASETVLGNITGGSAAVVAVALADLDSTSVVYDATTHTFQRAALTGDVTAAQNSNAFAFRSFSALSVLARAANSSGVPTELAAAANDRLLARTSDALSFTQLTAGMVPNDLVTNAMLANMAAGTVKGRQIDAGSGDPVDLTGGEIAEIIRFSNVTTEATGGTFTDYALDTLTDVWNITATSTITGVAGGTAGRHLFVFNGAASGSGVTITINQFSGSSAAGNRFLLPDSTDLLLHPGSGALFVYTSSRWRCFAATGTVAALRDGDKSDITVSSSGATWTIDTNINKAWTGTHSFTSSTHTITTTGDTVVSTGVGGGIGIYSGLTAADPAGLDIGITAAGGVAIGAGQASAVGTVTNGNIEMDATNRWIARSTGFGQIETGNDIWVSTTAGGVALSTEASHPTGVTNGLILLDSVGNVQLDPAVALVINTAGSQRLTIESDGSWNIGGSNGTSGHPLVSAGGSAPPAWGQLPTAGIADAAVTLAKMADLAQSRIIGRAEGAGTGVPQALTPTQVVEIIDGESPTWTASHRFNSFIQFGALVGGEPSAGDIRKFGAFGLNVVGILDISASSTTTVQTGGFGLNSVITPTALSADQNNYNPTGWAAANVVRLSCNSATDRAITGAAAGTDGEIKLLFNVGSAGQIQLKHEDTNSNSSGRFRFASLTTFNIDPEGGAAIWYDGTSDRWRALMPNIVGTLP